MQATDNKYIGIFTTREKAGEIINEYTFLEGFKDYLDGFCIDEFEVDMLTMILNGFDKNSYVFSPVKISKNYYWVLEFERPYLEDDYLDEACTIGYFSTREKAYQVKKFLENKPGFKEYKRGFYIGKSVLNRLSWTTGFITSVIDRNGNISYR